MVREKPSGEFVQRLRDRDPQAAQELFRRYASRLISIAQRHLSDKLTRRVEGEDVVQSVFRTFFRRAAQGEFFIDSSAELWRLLVKITLFKARTQSRHHTAQMRDVGLEVSEGGDAWLAEAMAREPGPVEAAVLVDQIESLLEGLPELYCRILQMRLAGHSVTETAAKLNVSRQTVYRALSLFKQQLSEEATA